MFTRTRYQNGSLRVKKRGNGLKIWEFRYYEPLPEGNGRSLRAVTVGTLQEYPTEAAARKSDTVRAMILRINAEQTLGPVTASTVGALIARYEKEGDHQNPGVRLLPPARPVPGRKTWDTTGEMSLPIPRSTPGFAPAVTDVLPVPSRPSAGFSPCAYSPPG